MLAVSESYVIARPLQRRGDIRETIYETVPLVLSRGKPWIPQPSKLKKRFRCKLDPRARLAAARRVLSLLHSR
jgi:hypothetical protein